MLRRPLRHHVAAAPNAEHATIEVRNGSGITGLGGKLSELLKSAGLTVLKPTDAKAPTVYPKTLVIVTGKGSYPNTVQNIVSATGAIVSELPAAEGSVKADILVIIGADAKK